MLAAQIMLVFESLHHHSDTIHVIPKVLTHLTIDLYTFIKQDLHVVGQVLSKMLSNLVCHATSKKKNHCIICSFFKPLLDVSGIIDNMHPDTLNDGDVLGKGDQGYLPIFLQLCAHCLDLSDLGLQVLDLILLGALLVKQNYSGLLEDAGR